MRIHFQLQGAVACLILLHATALAADAGAPPPTDSGAALANPLAASPLDRLSATRERPLFAPSRRPPPPPPPAPVVRQVEAPPAPPPTLALLGIVTDGEGARAMVRTQASDKVIRARLGDQIGGWRVTQIEARRLILSLDDRSVSYVLFERLGEKKAPTEPPMQNLAEGRSERRSRR